MDAPKSLEDLRHEAEVIQRQIDAQVIDEDGTPVPRKKKPRKKAAQNLPAKEPEEWTHDTVDFMDETWEVKAPQPKALAAFALASGKYINPNMQNNMVGLFIKNHLSEKSHERLYERMMDADDEFTQEHAGLLMQKIATVGTSRPTGPS
ncbi:hypothetical protein [Rhodococcus koreensis]